MKNAPRCGETAPWGIDVLSVKAGVDIVDVFFVQPILDQSQPFTEALEVDDFTGSQKFNDVVDIRIIGKTQNVVVGDAGLLLCCDRARTTFFKGR